MSKEVEKLKAGAVVAKEGFDFKDLIGEPVTVKVEGEPSATAKVIKIESFGCVLEFDKHIRVVPWSRVSDMRKNL